MRFITHTLLTSVVIAISALSFQAHALKADREQPINVQSIEQYADLQANKLVFSGDVIASQGTVKITADKIEVVRNNKGSLKSIIAYGSPVTFQQQQDNGRWIKSRSTSLSYFPDTNTIKLQGRAEIRQGESRMTGEHIEYNISTQKMRASNNNSQGGRVSSTFVPSDFQKNHKE